MLSFGVLGTLSVAAAGRKLSIAGSRQRTILALLLLSPDRSVSIDTLTDAVWQSSPPATARTQVAICVAALRKTFKAEGCEGEVISTAHPGYRFNSDGHELDLLQYRGLTAQAAADAREGRTGPAAEQLRTALGLWRGPVLAGVLGRQVEDEARHLEEQRLVTFDEFAMLQLKLGNHRELMPELSALLREHPLRERSLQSLILAQYRSGHRAEAMATFREARRRFIDDLGMDPGRELIELHEALLRDDPLLAAPESAAPESAGGAGSPAEPPDPLPGPEPLLRPGPHPQRRPDPQPTDPSSDPSSGQSSDEQTDRPDEPRAAPPRAPEVRVTPSDLPPNIPAFTGRMPQLKALEPLLQPRTDDQPPAVGLVTGVGGVGKTALAVHWAHSDPQRFPDGRLFVDMRGHDPDHEPTAADDVLSRFLRSLGVPGEQIPDGLAERVSLYRSLLTGRRVLIVLDNVRSYAQIGPLLPANGGCAVLVTSREPLEQLAIRHGAVRTQLGALSPAEADQLLARVITGDRPTAEPEQLRKLGDLCDRLPLALRIAGARLASKPYWTIKQLVGRLADERRRLDELSLGESQIRASFALSFRYLPEDAATLYRLLSTLDVPDTATWVSAALMDCDSFEAERLLDVLADAQLLEVVGADATGQLRYRFQNLLRLYACELARQDEQGPLQAEARERAMASWLSIAEEAHRREYGGDYSVLHGTTHRPLLEPELLEDLLASPLDWYEAERLALAGVARQASALASAAPESGLSGLAELAWDLVASTLVLYETRNYPDSWQRGCELALAACRAVGNVRGEAAMSVALGGLRLHQDRMQEAEQYLAPALQLFEKLGDRHGSALVLARLAAVDQHRGDLEQAGSRLRTAREALHQVGDLSEEVHALSKLAQIELDAGRLAEGLRLSEQAVALARGIGVNRGAAQAGYRLGRAYLEAGRPADAETVLLGVVDIVGAKHDQVGMCYALLGLAEARLLTDRAVQAEADLRQALEILERVDQPMARGRILLVLAEVRLALGDREEARACYAAARSDFARSGSLIWERRADEGRDRLDRLDMPS